MTPAGVSLLYGLGIGFAVGSLLCGALCWQIGWGRGFRNCKALYDSHFGKVNS